MCACGETRIPRDMCAGNRYPCDTVTDFILKMCYLGVKKKESGNQRQSTFTTLAAIFKIIPLLDLRNSKNSKRTLYIV